MAGPAEVVVAGHICLDVIPHLSTTGSELSQVLTPGSLVEIGPATVATGGAVSNTGLALHRLGVRTRLMGKIGEDLFGRAILDVLEGYGRELASGMLQTPGVPSSYTVVISPPNIDRIFLHCPGANDSFAADDVPYAELRGTKLFHFGYPPIMKRFWSDGGGELARLFEQARAAGVVTSLDMAMPDPNAPSGQIDWRALLERALPHVDVFLPSFEETLFMLDRAEFERLAAEGDLVGQASLALVRRLTQTLLDAGTAVVGLKLGERGLFVRTTADARRLGPVAETLGLDAAGWTGQERFTPCFEANVVGTTGAGDCTIAGFLAALVKGLRFEDAVTAAVAVGACNVEQTDAFSGVPAWDAVQRRLAAGWEQHAATLQ